MRRILPLIILGLGACAAPLDHIENRQTLTVESGERSFVVRAVFDVTRFGWAARVWSPDGTLGENDRDAAFAAVRDDLGVQVCDGGKMAPVDGTGWNGLAGANEQLNRSTGEWRFFVRCA